MMFELQHVPMPEGYGEALLPLDECKEHLRVLSDDEDGLIAILRDAAIEFVERYCELKLLATAGQKWIGEAFPLSGRRLSLGMGPVSAITAISWADGSGAAVAGALGDFRLVGTRGDVVPAIGGSWPSDVGGAIEVTFTAGYADGAAPPALLMAARLFLGHLYMNREAVIVGTISGEAPLGVTSLCAPFRRMHL